MFEKMKKTLPVRLLGDSVLNTKAKLVRKIDGEVADLAEKMVETMYKHNGIGLAAPQVGVPLRMFVLHVYPDEDEKGNPVYGNSPGEVELMPKMPLAFVNPEIVSYGKELEDFDEGCLSVPGLYAPVTRPTTVVFKAQLLDGREICLECGGLLARAIQHEYDHLDGIVFVQRLRDEDLNGIRPGLEKIIRKSGKRNFKINRVKQ